MRRLMIIFITGVLGRRRAYSFEYILSLSVGPRTAATIFAHRPKPIFDPVKLTIKLAE